MIGLGSDQAGYQLKESIKDYLRRAEIEFRDYGPYENESVDYPDFAFAVAKAVGAGDCDKGILICGTGIGMSIAANKIKGVRAAVCTDEFMAKATREHNDANILALGARVTETAQALKILRIFLETGFSEQERHTRRVQKISAFENKD